MLTENTFNALTILRAMLCGYSVEILGEKYAYDEESRKIGVLSAQGEENFIVFVEINLNRFLSMCEQVDPEQIREILAVLQYAAQETPQGSPDKDSRFH